MKKFGLFVLVVSLFALSTGCATNGCYSQRSWNPFRRQQVCYPVVETQVVDDCFSCGTDCGTCSTCAPSPVVSGTPITTTVVPEPTVGL